MRIESQTPTITDEFRSQEQYERSDGHAKGRNIG